MKRLGKIIRILNPPIKIELGKLELGKDKDYFVQNASEVLWETQ